MKCKIINHQKIVMLVIISSITIFSCTYEKAKLYKECVLPSTVSFNRDIVPIFNANCNTTGCHTSASNAGNLNLETAAAYAELMHHGSGYVDTLNPEFSILYSQLISISNPMPPMGKLDDCKIKLILKWIQQKAKNN
jgi:hypothetical protein